MFSVACACNPSDSTWGAECVSSASALLALLISSLLLFTAGAKAVAIWGGSLVAFRFLIRLDLLLFSPP